MGNCRYSRFVCFEMTNCPVEEMNGRRANFRSGQRIRQPALSLYRNQEYHSSGGPSQNPRPDLTRLQVAIHLLIIDQQQWTDLEVVPVFLILITVVLV